MKEPNATQPKLRHEILMFFYMVRVEHNLSFHPDTYFEDYVQPNGKPVFSIEEAEALNIEMDIYFDYCRANKLDIYEIAVQALNYDPSLN